MERDPFAFAGVNARTVAAAKQARELLAARFGLGSDDIAILKTSPAWSAMLTYCIESPLNIAWYDDKISSWKARRTLFIAGCVLVIAAVLSSIAQGGFADSRIAQVSAAVAALGACLRILGGAADVRTQLGGFWKARADLKESFLTFEQAWHGKVLAGGRVAESFETALWQEINNARHVVRGERENYFSTYVTTETLLATATSGLGEVLGRSHELRESQRQSRESQRAQMASIVDARRKLDEARAEEVAQAHLLSLITPRPASLAEESWQRMRDEAARAQLTAATDVARYSELVKALAKASTMNLE